MKPTRQLHDLGQSFWLDNITRELPSDGSLRRYIGELWVTGLTSNPTIFDKAIKDGRLYDGAVRHKRTQGKSGETSALAHDSSTSALTRRSRRLGGQRS